ncbi:hypothetical protein AB0368_30355 [Actinoplanes sp. NPDC051475]|uniref:hypothetical protein n=1 Tax=Actinoplanes sp. NPDC051475 TaxID=3157225 RepID=UPI003450E2AD
MAALLRMVRGSVAAVAISLVLVPAHPAAARASGAPVYGGPISRTQVMIRALDWLRRDIPYSQDNGKARKDINGGRRYRPDCSGFISMAWAIDTRQPGLGRALTTWELPRVSTRVRWTAMRRGDILLHLVPGNRAEEHVRLMQTWADAAHTRAVIIEQSGRTTGMRRRVVTVSEARGRYLPYRYRRIY